MNIEEFLQPKEEPETTDTEAVTETLPEENHDTQVEIDVQKAVVESLAADKAVQDEKIAALAKENAELKSAIKNLEKENETLRGKIGEQSLALNKVGEVLSANSTSELANQVALLDRSIEIKDRFPGETRDHVLEVLKEARNQAENEGRERRAQLLESVLVENVSTGNLAKKRASLEKLFRDNQNILSGPVIEELQKQGISHKKGEDYLLPSEIIKRSF